MIVFLLYIGSFIEGTGPEGEMREADVRRGPNGGWLGFKNSGGAEPELYVGTVINLETGETILNNASRDKEIPAWVRDPLLRAMKVAQFRSQQKQKTKKGQKKNESTELH